jgi:hypothetical protein
VAYGQSLTAQVQELRPGEELSINLSPLIPSTDLPAVISSSDLVILGRVEKARSSLTRENSSISTTYDIKVGQVLYSKNAAMSSPQQGVPPTVYVTTPGGTLTIDGHVVHLVDTSLPAFHPGADVVLCITSGSAIPGGNAIVYGPYGAFLVEGNRVRSLATDGAIRRKYDGMDVSAFSAIIQSGRR